MRATRSRFFSKFSPWNRGEFFDWFVTAQVPFLVEPLVKFLRPVVYLLHPSARFGPGFVANVAPSAPMARVRWPDWGRA